MVEIGGIRFAPLTVPLERRLQTLAIYCGVVWFVFGGFIGTILSIYLILFTRFWLETILYLAWLYLYDTKISVRGGRSSQWVRSWRWLKYMKEYFPVTLERLPWAELDPKKNYLFCCFPHGMIALGVVCSFGNEYGEFKTYFPHHKPHMVTLSQNFKFPFFRDSILAMGMIAADATSIDYVLKYPKGGNVCVLVPGGAQESYYCKPGEYRIILKKRRGFVKLALKNGTPLVPVLSFGETDTYDQVEGSTLRKVQEFIRKWFGFAPVVPIGRGLFQYSFGFVPRRKPIDVVVGTPMDVPKLEYPTPEQIEEYHSKFVKHLEEMFETQKYNYLDEPENKKLVIE